MASFARKGFLSGEMDFARSVYIAILFRARVAGMFPHVLGERARSLASRNLALQFAFASAKSSQVVKFADSKVRDLFHS